MKFVNAHETIGELSTNVCLVGLEARQELTLMHEGRGCAMEIEVDNKIQSIIEVEGKIVLHKMRVSTELNLMPNKLSIDRLHIVQMRQ